ncbi:MAG: YHYH protein [Okeania sp. SIO2D1]|nr:YHYH protein [Okeania sp. SIO2D1]
MKKTELSLATDNAIFLNGVKLDLLAAGCYGVGNGKIGCHDMEQPWRFDPMSSLSDFKTDSHNAHAQPDGTYHYHGSPVALFDSENAIVSPVIGFAADGFPIFGSYFDDNGTVRKAKSSYKLKEGDRQEVKGINPGGIYDGTYRDDYEYVAELGDLDECNGMTINGVYGYFVTDSYPWVMGCFKGTPDSSFNKQKPKN